jgi:hypothetical protein
MSPLSSTIDASRVASFSRTLPLKMKWNCFRSKPCEDARASFTDCTVYQRSSSASYNLLDIVRNVSSIGRMTPRSAMC